MGAILGAFRRWIEEFILFCGLGVLCGAGVGFFIFLRLGLPARPEDAGYMSGLFLLSGIKFGLSLWTVRLIFTRFIPFARARFTTTSKIMDDLMRIVVNERRNRPQVR